MVTLSTEKEDWGFVCGQVSVLEAGLLPRDFFQGLAGLEKLDDLLHRLQDTPLRDFVTPGASWEEWNDIVDQHFRHEMLAVRENSPSGAVAALFLLPGDYLNLKRALLRLGSYPFPANLFSEERLAAAAAGDLSGLPQDLRVTLARLGGSPSDDPAARAALDTALDGAYLRHMLNLAVELDIPMISAYVDDLVLSRAVTMVWRAARSGQPLKALEDHVLPLGGHTHIVRALLSAGDPRGWGALVPGVVGDCLRQALESADKDPVQAFDLHVSNALMNFAKGAKLQTMGPERVAGYFVGLKAQVFNLKLVISGRFNGIDPEMLRRRLRECYV